MCNEIKEEYKIQAQGLQERMMFFHRNYWQTQNLGILCYSKLATKNCSLLVETDNGQFVSHLFCIIWYSQVFVSADNFTPAEDSFTQTVVSFAGHEYS